ncbi:MAG: exodeoxyribonuclease V subunit gamma [Opitutales bacterium]|nr:exodeoxyribonuclease V subunit gamma [Opitutales bacterium]
MSFHLHTSNETESLLTVLLDEMIKDDPLVKRVIVTSGKGMQNWLKLEIAKQHGVSANLHFVTTERIVWQMSQASIQNFSDSMSNPFSKERIAWKIRNILSGIILDYPKEFNLIDSFIESEDSLKKIQFCWEVATVFDGYLHYRPELIQEWENGEIDYQNNDAAWQGLLWRRISSELPCPPISTLCKENSFAKEAPNKIYFFGFSPIPPVYVQAFVKYGENYEMHAFCLQPTHHYWREVLSNREKLIKQEEGEAIYLELGPPLLGALGKSWQKFILLLEDLDIYEPNFIQPTTRNSSNSALSALHHHLLEMPEGNNPSKLSFLNSDHSVQFHSCHSSLREVQVLQDFLLDQFNQNPDLLPSDILIVCPQIQEYSALIKCVFDNPESAETKIPYGICDRQWRNESRIIDTFYHLLEFAEGRASSRDFYSLISRPAICQKFDIGEPELEIIRWWIEETKIAWGFDTEHKESLDLPPLSENTWQNGLDRMFLGFCSGNSAAEPFDELLPFNEIEGSRVALFSKLIAILDCLKKLSKKCSVRHQPSDWQNIIEDFVLNNFFVDDEKNHPDLTELRKSLAVLTDESIEHADEEPLSVIRFHLERTLNDKSLFSRHFTSGITFCSLRSARGIPAKIICHLGLNGGSFPSPPNRPSFDLCKLSPRYSDRNHTEEDRLLILESLLSCRETIYFSFLGQSNKNNEKIPPSVIVDEILEQLDQVIDFSLDESVEDSKDAFCFHHPLQPFGKNYFKKNDSLIKNRFLVGKQIRSFSKMNCDAASALTSSRAKKKLFYSDPLANQHESSNKYQLNDVIDFWKGPCNYFLKKGLGISIWDHETLLPENERLDLCAFKDSSIKTKMIQRFIHNDDSSENPDSENSSFRQSLYLKLKKMGCLPPGKLGKALNDSLLGEVRVIVNRGKIPFDENSVLFTDAVNLGNAEVAGNSAYLFENNQALFFPSKLKGKHCIEGLIRHLWINSTQEFAGRIRTVISGQDMGYILKPREQNLCREQFLTLIELFREGLTRPLPFFPNSSLSWLNQKHKQRNKKPKKSDKSPISCAENTWVNKFGGEAHEFANQLCYPSNPWENEDTIEMNDHIMNIMDMDGEFLR